MKQRLADYVAHFLVACGVTDVFSVVGGGAMHLNDALGNNPGLKVTYKMDLATRAVMEQDPDFLEAMKEIYP